MSPRTYVTEADVKNEVKKLLTKHGWFWWCPPGNGYGSIGIADFNAIKDGVFLAIETKFGSNKPTKKQKAYLESIAAESGFGFAVSEKHLADLNQWLSRFNAATAVVVKGGTVPSEDGRALVDLVAALTAMIAPGGATK